jgi:hypothetical protein
VQQRVGRIVLGDAGEPVAVVPLVRGVVARAAVRLEDAVALVVVLVVIRAVGGGEVVPSSSYS